MARDKFYRPGDYYQLDDISGFKVRASETRQQWDQAVTTRAHFSPRQPQDLVVGVRDDQSVAIPRPRQRNRFVIVGSEVAAPAARGAHTIEVASSVGFTVGDLVQIMLDSGVAFQVVLSAISGNDLTWVGGTYLTGLPATVGTLYGDPIENQVLVVGVGTAVEVNLYDNGGVLTVEAAAGYPISTAGLAPGSVWSNGLSGEDGSVGIVGGVVPDPAAPSVYFPGVTAAELLIIGGGNLPLSGGAVGSGLLWNNGGEVAVS